MTPRTPAPELIAAFMPLARILIDAGYFPAGLPDDPDEARAVYRAAVQHLFSQAPAESKPSEQPQPAA